LASGLTGVFPAPGCGIQRRFCSFEIPIFRALKAQSHREHLFPSPISPEPMHGVISRAHTEIEMKTEVRVMLSWVVTFLVIALIAGVLGFGGIAGASVEIAKIIFFIAVVLFLVSAVVGLARGRTRV
jgi:uncharacterized membrane protein YtjA (UPF0391 family)